ncbi:MAG: hypothetical protein L0099_07350 [Acidobacteria bacterium]|nr:hypothetical protein [Acidobacteriota bacterium]
MKYLYLTLRYRLKPTYCGLMIEARLPCGTRGMARALSVALDLAAEDTMLVGRGPRLIDLLDCAEAPLSVRDAALAWIYTLAQPGRRVTPEQRRARDDAANRFMDLIIELRLELCRKYRPTKSLPQGPAA